MRFIRATAVDGLPSPRAIGGGLHFERRPADRTPSVHLAPRAFLEAKGRVTAQRHERSGVLLRAGVRRGARPR